MLNDRAKLIRALFTPERSNLQLTIGLSIVIAVLSLAFPIAVQALVNNISFTGLTQPLIILTLILFVVLLCSTLSQLLQMWLMERVQRRIFVRSAAGVTAFLSTLAPEKVGDKVKKFAEVSAVQKGFTTLWIEGLSLVLRLVAGFLILMLYHPSLAGVSVVLMILVSLVVLWGLEDARSFAVLESNAKYQWIHDAADPEHTPRTIEEGVNNSAACTSYLEARKNHFRILFRQAIFIFVITLFAGASILALGGVLMLQGELTVGELVASEMIIGNIVFSLFKVPKFLEQYYDFEASFSKISQIFEDAPMAERKSRRVFRRFAIGGTGLTRRVSIALVGCGVSMILMLALPWVQTSLGHGRVVGFMPDERPQTVEATISGRIKQWKIAEGQIVQKGDVLLELEDLDPQAMERLEDQRAAIESQLRAILINRKVAKTNLERQSILEKDGIVSRRAREVSEMELAKVTYEEGVILGKLAEIDLKISRQRAQTVQAPVSGFVSRVFRGQGGEILKQGDPLLVIVPETTNKMIELWVDGMDAPLLHVGQNARIQFEGWPAFQFTGWPELGIGTFPARVRAVDQTDDKGKFRVILEDPDNSWPKGEILRQGTRAIGMILLGRVSVGYEIWRRINGFPVLPPDELTKQAPNSRSKAGDVSADEK